jgi:glycogen debranching enzyme
MDDTPHFPRTLLPAPPEPRGPARSTSEDLAKKRYAAAGDRAYVIGMLDGSFPPIGTRICGEMGGVWAHPIKLLEGYWLALDGAWLPPATRFVSGAGYVQLHLPGQDGLSIIRTEFAPNGLPAVIVGLTLHNDSAGDKHIRLAMAIRSQLLAAYPWSDSDPEATAHNGKDVATYDPRQGIITIARDDQPWRAMIGSSVAPASGAAGDHLWGPVPEEQREKYSQAAHSTGAELHWRLALRGGEEQTLWVVMAGAHTSPQAAEDALRHALADPSALMLAQIRERVGLLEQTQWAIPDPRIMDALTWSVLNMAELRRTVTDMQVRDVDEGKAYPPPIATVPEVHGIGDGYPDYPWFYGTGSGYIIYPLIAAGMWETTIEHQRLFRDVSRAINGSTGKVVHEIASDGSVYFGNNASRGDTNETALFVTAIDLLWRWSGDDSLLDEMYDFLVDGMRYITTDLDADGDLWPEGNGIGERPGMGPEHVDVAAGTWQALRALDRMAAYRGDEATATWARQRADAMEAAFDAAWWVPEESLYADSRCNGDQIISEDERREKGWTNVCTAPHQQLQQRIWISVTPMETTLAPAERAHAALDRLESPAFSGPCGLYLVGEGGGPDGNAVKKCWTVMAGVMALAEAHYGRLGANQALKYMGAIAGLIDLEQPGALPEVAPSPEYDAFGDLTERMMFSQAWAGYGLSWTLVRCLLGIEPDVPARKLVVIPQVPPDWPGLAAQRMRVGRGSMAVTAEREAMHYRTSVDAPEGLRLTIGHTLPRDAEIDGVTLDGAPAEYVVRDTIRGREVQVETTTGALRTLEVVAGTGRTDGVEKQSARIDTSTQEPLSIPAGRRKQTVEDSSNV